MRVPACCLLTDTTLFIQGMKEVIHQYRYNDRHMIATAVSVTLTLVCR